MQVFVIISLLILFSFAVNGFNKPILLSRISKSSLSKTSTSLQSSLSPSSSRDEIKNKIANALAKTILFSAAMAQKSTSPANAKVFFDTDVYGDKELKIATVNKIKQKLRNAILNDLSIAPLVLELAINDALGFDINSTDGGPDGSIQFEMERDGNKGLSKALEVITVIKNELQRTNTVGLADLIAFGGGEVLETVGCPRVTVQVGRFDSKKENNKLNIVNWGDNSGSTSNIANSFYSSGLEPKDIVLLLGALGEVKRIVKETLIENEKNKKNDDDEEVVDNPDDLSWQDNVPSTFGERSAAFGAKMGKSDFGSKYLASLLSKKGPAEEDLFGKCILEDPKMKVFVVKYSSNQGAFLADVPSAYSTLNLLGQSYTTRNS